MAHNLLGSPPGCWQAGLFNREVSVSTHSLSASRSRSSNAVAAGASSRFRCSEASGQSSSVQAHRSEAISVAEISTGMWAMLQLVQADTREALLKLFRQTTKRLSPT